MSAFYYKRRKKFLLKVYIFDILKILIGTIFLAFGIAQFLLPNQLSSGGFSGIATIIYYLFKIPLGTTILILNIPLFIIAFFKIGKRFLIKAIIGTSALSIFLNIFQNFPPLTDDRFLACIYGGVIVGLGTAIILRAKASTGGTDLIANIVKEYSQKHKTGNLIVIFDIIIVSLNILFFKEIEIALYSTITIYLMGKIIDIFFEGIYFTKLILIVSDKYQKISDKINKEVRRGTTGLLGQGMYKKEDKTILLCVANRTEVMKIIRITQKTDPLAFIIISNAREVFGKGFKRKI